MVIIINHSCLPQNHELAEKQFWPKEVNTGYLVEMDTGCHYCFMTNEERRTVLGGLPFCVDFCQSGGNAIDIAI